MCLLNADNQLTKLGFVKTYESPLCVQYERLTEFGYRECLELGHKETGRHLIHMYQRELNAEGFNNSVGISAFEAFWAIIKMMEKGWNPLSKKGRLDTSRRDAGRDS